MIRQEPATAKTGGQVHLQDTDDFKYMQIDGVKKSQFQWTRDNALGIVEYDREGKITQIRTFAEAISP